MEDTKMQQALRLFGELAAEQASLGLLDSEARRHTDNRDLFETMIREAYNEVTTIAVGHHIMVICAGRTLPIEIPSADALIFDHGVALVIWGSRFEEVLTKLALEPTATRDALLRSLYYGRSAS